MMIFFVKYVAFSLKNCFYFVVGCFWNFNTHLFQEKNYPEAEAAYRKAIELKPDCSIAFRNRGISHCNLGKHLEAIIDFISG